MKLNILAFGIAKDIIGQRNFTYEVRPRTRVRDLLQQLQQTYPAFEGLASIKIAVNSEYVSSDQILSEADEVVIIPPVSGG